MTTIPLNSIQNPELSGQFIILCIALTIFDFVMKWIAMYKAWTRRQIWRFIIIFILNTCGILPIIYLLSNRDKDQTI